MDIYEICDQKLEKALKDNRIVITVKGGVAEVYQNNTKYSVEIVDFDNIEAEFEE